MRSLRSVLVGTVAVTALAALPQCSLLTSSDGLAGGRGAQGSASDAGGARDAASGTLDGTPGVESGADAALPPLPADGLLLWLRGDDGVEATNDRVTAWRDSAPKVKVGALPFDAVQTSVEVQPRRGVGPHGLTTVVFAGNSYLGLPTGFEDFSRGVTLFVAATSKLEAGGYGGTMFATGIATTACGRAMELSYGNLGAVFRVENVAVGTYNSVVADTWGIDSVTLAAGSACDLHPAEIRRDGVTVLTDQVPGMSTKARSGSVVGRSNYFDDPFQGSLGELIVYARALTATETMAINAYLRAKWLP